MSAPTLELITWTLAHSLWQATAAAALLAVVHALVPPERARARYAAALGALLVQIAAPLATLALLSRAPARPVAAAIASGSGSPLPVWIALLWLSGASVMALRLGAGLLGVRRMVSQAEALGPEWTPRFEALRSRFGITRKVRWLASRRVDVPATAGCLRPVIILPLSALTGLPPHELELLVGHELLHVRRWDYLVNLLQSVVEVALFFHPAMWWVSGRVRAEREACCDDAVVRAGADPLAYARALAALEQHRARTGELLLASNGGGSLMWRIQRLLQPGRGRRSVGASWGALAGALVVVAGVAVAAVPSTRVSNRWLPPVLEPHRAVIEAAAARHGIDADLLAILVLAESNGNERAVSPLGARGLMQLMPKTAERVARERGVAFSVERLDEPAFNVDLGATYLAQQLARFEASGDPVSLAIAAYNGGPERAQAWAEGKAQLSEETLKYHRLVLGMWRERAEPKSSAYEAWRGRLRTRLAGLAVAPVPEAKVTMRFGEQRSPDGGAYPHAGVDLAAASGTSVLSPLDGVVKEVTSDAERGNVVVLQHAGGVQTRYHHLGTVQVKAEQPVRRGEPFATVGATGKVTGPHVHFEVLDLGQPIDPSLIVR